MGKIVYLQRRRDYGSGYTTYIVHWDCAGDDFGFTYPTEQGQGGRIPSIRSSGQPQFFY